MLYWLDLVGISYSIKRPRGDLPFQAYFPATLIFVALPRQHYVPNFDRSFIHFIPRVRVYELGEKKTNLKNEL